VFLVRRTKNPVSLVRRPNFVDVLFVIAWSLSTNQKHFRFALIVFLTYHGILVYEYRNIGIESSDHMYNILQANLLGSQGREL